MYVVDGEAGQRIEQFSADGGFVRAWGRDVVSAGGSGDVLAPPVVVDERQSVAVNGPFDFGCFCFGPVTGGTFTLSLGGEVTGPIAFDASAVQVEAALEALDGVDAATVTGGPGPDLDWVAEFGGALSGMDVADLVVDGSGLLPVGSSGFVSILENGSTTPDGPGEVCTVAEECQGGKVGSGDGEFSLGGSQVAVDQSDGSVYVADSGNDRIQKFTGAGVFVDEFGTTGSGAGELSGPLGVGVDPVSGDVYVADTNNNRVQRFDSGGAFVDEIGTTSGGSGDGEFFGPSRVAVDSTGRLYVLDSGNGRVQRFDSAGVFDGVFAAGGYNSPSDLAVDPASDNVLIVGSTSDFSISGVLEFDASGTAVDVHAANLGISSGGISVRSSTGQIFVSDSPNDRVMILGQVSPPTVSIEPVTGVATDGATFNGLVNPQGPTDVGYRFEYSTDGTAWTCVPDPSCDPASNINVGSGTGDVPVSQTVSGLDVSTEYRVRLVAAKTFNGGTASSDETTFTTDPVPPLVRAIRQGNTTDTAAWIGGEVNPQNSPTDAYVEYTLDTDTAFANSQRVPAAPDTVDVGDGSAFVETNQLATGLQPNTGYRYRVVATNEGGQTVGSARTFITTPSVPEPPKGRGYEMVSPLDKNGADIERNIYAGNQAMSGAAVSGDRVAFASLGQFAGIASGATVGQYVSARDASTQKWVTRGITPPTTPQPATTTNTPEVLFLSEGLTQAVVGTTFPLTPEASLLGARRGLYRQSLTGPVFSYDLMSTPANQMTQFPVGDQWFDFVGASSDMRHVAFDSTLQLTADGPLDGSRGVYEWADGQLRFVSVLPSGQPASEAAAGGNSSIGLGFSHVGDHPVSDDGQRVFFTVNPEATGQGLLYVREQGQVTRPVSASQRPGDDPSVPRPAKFRAARASDGRLVLFTSSDKLTDDATASTAGSGSDDLYLWDRNAPEGQRLTDLTTADPEGGGVLNVTRAADDLSHVYFVATGNLADGAIASQPNLYAWTPEDGVRHVAVLDAQRDGGMWGVEREYGPEQFRDTRVNGDGARLLFESYASPTADATGESKQIYLYDYDRDHLVCVSCPQDDPPAGGDSWLFFPTDLGTSPYTDPRMPYRLPRNLSEDGKRAFFETAQGLLDSDTNGKPDVYMWSGGELSLISSGGGGEGSQFIDASPSSDDVFFLTRERMVGADTDNQVDVYDARVEGGFPEQELPPVCVGDKCRGPASSPPNLPAPGSGIDGPDDIVTKRPSLSVGQLSVAERRGLAAGRRIALVVRVNESGRVAVRGIAKLDRRSRTVARASGNARRAGRVRIGVRLTGRAHAALVKSRRLRVTFRVAFKGLVEERSVSLAAPSSKGGRR